MSTAQAITADAIRRSLHELGWVESFLQGFVRDTGDHAVTVQVREPKLADWLVEVRIGWFCNDHGTLRLAEMVDTIDVRGQRDMVAAAAMTAVQRALETYRDVLGRTGVAVAV